MKQDEITGTGDADLPVEKPKRGRKSAAPKVEKPKKVKLTLLQRVPVEIDIAAKDSWLFADGGLLSANPSTLGGMWCWIRTHTGVVTHEATGFLFPADTDRPVVTSPNSEVYALAEGIVSLPDGWTGTIASDCIFALNVFFDNYPTQSIPETMMPLVRRAKDWLKRNAGQGSVQWKHLAGHPNEADLLAGKRQSKAPHFPVSRFNVMCDDKCNEIKGLYFKSLEGGRDAE